MATTPSGTKFIGTSPSVNTDKRKSDLSNSYQSVSTLSELSDDVKNAQYTIDPSSVGEAVTFTRLDYEDKVDVIIPGILEIARDNNGGGIYNKAAEESFNGNSSPRKTVWNSKYVDEILSGYSKAPLLNTQLNFATFRNSLDGNIGINILHTELIFAEEETRRAWMIKFHQWTPGGNGGGFSYTRQEIFTSVYFERPNNATDTVDVISDGLIIKRNNQKGIFNAALESQYDDNAYQSPLGTEWNSEYTDDVNSGWYDLTNVRKRVYGTWRDAVDANPLATLGKELVMHDLSTDLYYTVKFLDWTPNANGGGFVYERKLIPVNQGIRFSDGTFMDTAPEGSSIDSNGNLIISDDINKVDVGNGQGHLIDNFSGMLIVNDHYDGRVETWIAGGGDAVLLGATNLGGGTCGSTLTMASGGYEWINVDNLTGPFTFTVIKTRQEA
jgi:hypothetical protein